MSEASTRVLSLRPLDEIDRCIRKMNEAMQTVRARALRIARIREMLATLSDDERFGIASELLGSSEDELLLLIQAGLRSLGRSESDNDAQGHLVDHVQ